MKKMFTLTALSAVMITIIFCAKVAFAGQGAYAFSFNYIKSNPSQPSDTSTAIYFYNPSPNHEMTVSIIIGGSAGSACKSGTPASGLCGTFPDPTGVTTRVNETVTLAPQQFLDINPENDSSFPAGQVGALGALVKWSNPVNDSNKLVVDVSQVNHNSSGSVISNTQIPVNTVSIP